MTIESCQKIIDTSAWTLNGSDTTIKWGSRDPMLKSDKATFQIQPDGNVVTLVDNKVVQSAGTSNVDYVLFNNKGLFLLSHDKVIKGTPSFGTPAIPLTFRLNPNGNLVIQDAFQKILWENLNKLETVT